MQMVYPQNIYYVLLQLDDVLTHLSCELPSAPLIHGISDRQKETRNPNEIIPGCGISDMCMSAQQTDELQGC